ncbi:transcriptional activator RfaH [Thioclava sp. DLFJ5-1]|uniref:transcription termination/antitermination protein NusG n=1 Tax=Thioclava sp. DLFJ5-1 TaxID=1915314 RepID=UPI000996D8AC|nr:transcription termination/antitermination NusG family protein [Thioclava sp. DLFJ5-1]OOY22020.1 transcriptional activator RfaH [Thioclava sp. DLFJ5-1]
MVSLASNGPWFLAQLKPNSAAIAQAHLERQGIESFLPTEMHTRRRAGRFDTRRCPLFPGYLFVAFDPEKGLWRKINATRGIARLVSFGSVPRPVPSELIAQIAERCDAAHCLRAQQGFVEGDEVRVASGPLVDFIATIDSIDPDRRVWLLMDIMGAATRVAVPASELRAKDG